MSKEHIYYSFVLCKINRQMCPSAVKLLNWLQPPAARMLDSPLSITLLAKSDSLEIQL